MKLEKSKWKLNKFSEKVDEHLDSLMCRVWTKSEVKKSRQAPTNAHTSEWAAVAAELYILQAKKEGVLTVEVVEKIRHINPQFDH